MEGNEVLMIFFAVFGGGVPPLVWLWFWLKEDIHPEPKILIFATFIAGAVAASIAFFVESLLESNLHIVILSSIALLIFAAVEEGFKFIAAKTIALSNKNFDEPVDAIIYLISAALGFAALENILFLTNILANFTIPFFTVKNIFLDVTINTALISNSFRFIGATVLHTVASGVLGVFIGLSFYKSKVYKFFSTLIGLAVAILLHTAFNYLIMKYADKFLIVFLGIWVFAIILILFFERVKRVHKNIYT